MVGEVLHPGIDVIGLRIDFEELIEEVVDFSVAFRLGVVLEGIDRSESELLACAVKRGEVVNLRRVGCVEVAGHDARPVCEVVELQPFLADPLDCTVETFLVPMGVDAEVLHTVDDGGGAVD